MELVFLLVLLLILVTALLSGFPVAFALPGSAVIAIGLAALCGYLLVGDPGAFFVDGGPVEWLTAGITNFRSVYWNVERDTLIAVPLFIFMGIMLQRSRVAEDLLVTMAKLFGPVPGGLGISVVLVGALLAATTGIVGATVIAMGMISLPAMLQNRYSHSLATGTICASGTLGQIIPPSIVLIILADQLASAADQASNLRASAYRAATGEYSMPSVLDVTSTSAGNMFLGAIIPGLILVGLYAGYILVRALINPRLAPPVPHQGHFDGAFLVGVFKALVPPLTLIILVLGSILTGVATVNQAGAVGAAGAILMGGYRLHQGRRTYAPVILVGLALALLAFCVVTWPLNVKNIGSRGEALGILLASLAVVALLAGVCWSLVRIQRCQETLVTVMQETVKTTSMVFIILIGAAMLTAAFRAFGGEELVRQGLGSLPGGFWTQFLVVMLVIFLLGFFLDFIEITVVVVPLVAPILLAAPDANVTAIWLGVMLGMNLQTSFLTPPFGFALFYLRGVAPKVVKTLSIYKGVAPFIGLQLLGLLVVGSLPWVVNYLPNRSYLLSETAPPPSNPRLQLCLEETLFPYYDAHQNALQTAVADLRAAPLHLLPATSREDLDEALSAALNTFDRVAAVRQAKAAVTAATEGYQPLHHQVRDIEAEIARLEQQIEDADNERLNERYSDNTDEARIARLEAKIESLKAEQARLKQTIPASWPERRRAFQQLTRDEKMARLAYRRNADEAYEPVQELLAALESADTLAAQASAIRALEADLEAPPFQQPIAAIRQLEERLEAIPGAGPLSSDLAGVRRALDREEPRLEKAQADYRQALQGLEQELSWRQPAAEQLLPALRAYEDSIDDSLGLRQQARLPRDRALEVASCLSHHRDISLFF